MRNAKTRIGGAIGWSGLAVAALLDSGAARAAPSSHEAAASAGEPVIRVCVDVVPKSWGDETSASGSAPPAPGASAPASAPANAPASGPRRAAARPNPAAERDRPEYHLRRLLEYEVTHDEAYEAVSQGCEERMVIELYELNDGWTVFGRFSRYAREEKVDHVQSDEFGALAERMARALLHDKPIDETITRNNVLRDDSEVATRAIRGSSYLELGLGTIGRVGILPTAPEDGGPAKNAWRFVAPVAVSGGYREKVRNWGLEAYGRLAFGTNELAVGHNEGGGHADYSWGVALGLHFLRYTDPAGMNSFYFGGGATFELQRFTIIRPAATRGINETRDELWTGGLDLDGIAGYEFMRASAVHFFTQLDINLPAYVIQTENASGKIETYFPGALAQVGLLF